MEFFLKYDRDWEQTKKLPRNPNIRMYNVPQRAFEGHTTHNRSGYGYWFDDSDPALALFPRRPTALPEIYRPQYRFLSVSSAATGAAPPHPHGSRKKRSVRRLLIVI